MAVRAIWGAMMPHILNGMALLEGSAFAAVLLAGNLCLAALLAVQQHGLRKGTRQEMPLPPSSIRG